MSDSISLEESYTFWISRLANQLQEQFNRELSVMDISWPQWMVINLVAQGKASSPAQLAHIIGVDRSAITRLVDRLEKKGMVVRQAVSSDKRSVAVVLSDAGARVVQHLDDVASQHEHSVRYHFNNHFGQEFLGQLQQLFADKLSTT